MGFDIYFESVKKSTNSDIIAAITNIENADATFTKVTKFRLSNDENAQVLNMSDEELRKIWKYKHADLINICKREIIGFKQNTQFNKIKKLILEDINCAYKRKLDSKNPKSPSQVFYTDKAIVRI